MTTNDNLENNALPLDTSWEEVHQQATIIDLHAHPSMKALLFRRSLSKRAWVPEFLMGEMNPLSIRTSFANLQAGGVDVLLSTVYPPEKQIFTDLRILKFIPLSFLRHVPLTLAKHIWNEFVAPPYFEVTQAMLDDMALDVTKYNRKRSSERREVVVAHSGEELQTYLNRQNPPISLVHSIEGGHSLFGETSLQILSNKTWDNLDSNSQTAVETEVLDNLKTLSKRGVAYLTLAHFYPNHLITPTFPYPEHIAMRLLPRTKVDRIRREARLTQGLTALGKKVVQKMIEYGILIDVSHATPKARQEIYALVEQSQRQSPIVIATHVGAYEINPTAYNLEDWEIRWIGEHGGVIGTIFMTHWLMPHETKYGLNFLSRNIEHFYQVGGEDVVGIGTDFDGADPPDDIDDAAQLPLLTRRLMGEYRGVNQPKYTTGQIQKFLGGNALRVLLTGWGK